MTLQLWKIFNGFHQVFVTILFISTGLGDEIVTPELTNLMHDTKIL